MNHSPIDESHEDLKAQFIESCRRVSRGAKAHSTKTKTLQAIMDDNEEKIEAED